MKYTAAQIKAEGGRRFIKRNKKRLFIALVASLVWVPVAMFFVQGNSVFNEYAPHVKVFIYLAAPILVVVNIFLSYRQACALFYQKVKQNPDIL